MGKVLIIKSFKPGETKARLIFLPESALINFLVRHVELEDLHDKETTVLIREKPNIFGSRKVKQKKAVKILIYTFRFFPAIYPGAQAYAINHDLFQNTKLIQVNKDGDPTSDMFEGAICARLILVPRNKIKKELFERYNLSYKSREKVKKTINKLVNFPGVKKISFFIITHIHPIRRGARCN